MFLVTIYENGRRYFSAPADEMPGADENTTINGATIQAKVKTYPDGDRFDTIVQEISEDEFSQYKQDPAAFTAKRVF